MFCDVSYNRMQKLISRNKQTKKPGLERHENNSSKNVSQKFILTTEINFLGVT